MSYSHINYSKRDKNFYKGNIFQSDMKYKKFRKNVNKSMPGWYTITPDDLMMNQIDTNVDMDTIEYRMEESKAQGYKVIDLSHLELDEFPKLPEQIEIIFASNNNFTIIPDLTSYNLKCLDLSNNKLTKCPKTKNIEELNISNNLIKNIDILKNLEIIRLDISKNQIKNIPYIKKIQRLEARDNIIEIINTYNTLKDLRIKNNCVKKIPSMENLEIIDCINNKLEIIEDQSSMREFYANNNNIKKINRMPAIRVLSLYKNPINSIKLIFNNITNLVVDNKDFYIPKQLINKIKKKSIFDKEIIELEF